MITDTLRRTFALTPQRGFILALCVFFVGVSIQYSLKAAGNRSAIRRWQPQLDAIEDGTKLYDVHTYPNTPMMALILRPLNQLSPVAHALSWFYLKVGMALLSIFLVCKLVETPERPFPPWAKGLTVLLSLTPITNDLTHGNINLFILFLIVTSLYAYHKEHDTLAGVVLALAIVCKVTPALFLPYFLWKRAWKTLAGAGVGLVLFLWLVPAALLGWQQNQRLLEAWFEQMIVPFVVKGEVWSEHINQSIPGLVVRLLTASPSFYDRQHLPSEWHNFVALSPAAARLLVKGLMLCFAGLVVWSCRTPTRSRQGWRLAAEYSLIVVGMLLFSERTWKHHCVTFLLPFAVVSYYLATCQPSPALRRYLLASLAAVVLLMGLTSKDLLPDRFAKLTQVYGAYVWAYAVLVAALVLLLRRGATSGREEIISAGRASDPPSACAAGLTASLGSAAPCTQ